MCTLITGISSQQTDPNSVNYMINTLINIIIAIIITVVLATTVVYSV